MKRRFSSFPGSAWERTALQAPPALIATYVLVCNDTVEAEPRQQCVPRQSLGTREILTHAGYSLVEMVVAMSLILVLMTVSGTLFVALSRSERNAQRSAASQQTISRLESLFRRDVHQAQSAAVAPDDRGQPVLTLSLPGNSTVRYAAEEAKLARIAVTGGQTHRDDFRIAAGQWQFEVRDRQVELRLSRPADTVTQSNPADLPLRDCRLMAVLSLTPATLSKTGAVP